MNFKALLLTCAILCASSSYAQSKLTKEQILSMSTEELSDLSLEDLMQAVETLGVSSVDELFAMIMNKNVSSASKKEEDSFTSPLSSTVITKAEMRTYGITTIEEALRLIPGMIVTEKTNGVYDVQMRGLNNIPDNQMFLYTENSNTLLMIDGRVVQDYAMGSLNFEMLPIGIEDIERIEVVRGANAALYGLNAVTGVINIITEKTTSNSKKVSGNFQMGTAETYVGDIAIRQNFSDKLSLGITANLQYRRRPTNQLYILPGESRYFVDVPDNELPAIGSKIEPEVIATYMAEVEKSRRGEKSFIKDASQGGYYNMTDINHIKQIYSLGVLFDYLPTNAGEKLVEMIMKNYGVTDPARAAEVAQSILGGMKSSVSYQGFNILDNHMSATNCFADPGLARKSFGFNGYMTFTPTKDVRLDLSAGYQQSSINTTPCGELPFALATRESKSGYANLNASIYGLNFSANYTGGPRDYEVGAPGFKVATNQFEVSAEYDFNIGDLTIRPGIEYTFIKYKDYTPDYNNPNDPNDFTWSMHEPDSYKYQDNTRHMSGYLNYAATMTDIAPMLRLDYKVADWRFIAAVRGDKTNIPDKWNVSYQGSVSYSINDNNFIRASYSSAMRSANMVNTSSDYTWDRKGMMSPDIIEFTANKEADLMNIRNAELGYRWRPTNKLLIDAEAYYSISQDYSALMSSNSKMQMPAATLRSFLINNFDNLKNLAEGSSLETALDLPTLGTFMTNVDAVATLQNNNLPYKVKQYGFGMNIDWIISSKLIAKVNANVQNTTIDKYYQYNQNKEILSQFASAASLILTVPSLVQDLYGSAKSMMEPMMEAAGLKYEDLTQEQIIQGLTGLLDLAMGQAPINDLTALYGSLDAAGQANLLNQLYTMTYTGQVNGKNLEKGEQYTGYYGLKYGVRNLNGTFCFGDATRQEAKTTNGHKHKATPSIYGAFGLIFKPTNTIEVSTFGNFIGKRTYETKYGAEELPNRFTMNMKVGYKPTNGIEVFLNAHNLFNTKDREFTFCDKVGGVYSIGVNFGF